MVTKNVKIKAGTDLWIEVLNPDGSYKTCINIDNRTSPCLVYYSKEQRHTPIHVYLP